MPPHGADIPTNSFARRSGHVREVDRVFEMASAVNEGGVRLLAAVGVGSAPIPSFDPIVTVDLFDMPAAASFPLAPYRGSEVLLAVSTGSARIKDTSGHNIVVNRGESHWMAAGRGIGREETADQAAKGLRILLASKRKDDMPHLRAAIQSAIPRMELAAVRGHATLFVHSGTLHGAIGPLHPSHHVIVAELVVLHDSVVALPVPGDTSECLVIVEDGAGAVGGRDPFSPAPSRRGTRVGAGSVAILSPGSGPKGTKREEGEREAADDGMEALDAPSAFEDSLWVSTGHHEHLHLWLVMARKGQQPVFHTGGIVAHTQQVSGSGEGMTEWQETLIPAPISPFFGPRRNWTTPSHSGRLGPSWTTTRD